MYIAVTPNTATLAPRRAVSGFTTIELLVTVVLLGILASLAAPSFTDMFRRFRVDTAREEFMASVNLARGEAIRQGLPVVIRPWIQDFGYGPFPPYSADQVRAEMAAAFGSITNSLVRGATSTSPSGPPPGVNQGIYNSREDSTGAGANSYYKALERERSRKLRCRSILDC